MKTYKPLVFRPLFITIISTFLLGCSESLSNYSIRDNLQDITSKESSVFITPNGKCYHSTPYCTTLKKSRIIEEVDFAEVQTSRRPCKVCH